MAIAPSIEPSSSRLLAIPADPVSTVQAAKYPEVFAELGKEAVGALSPAERARFDLYDLACHKRFGREAFFAMCHQLAGIPCPELVEAKHGVDVIFTAIGARGMQAFLEDFARLAELVSRPGFKQVRPRSVPNFAAKLTQVLDAARSSSASVAHSNAVQTAAVDVVDVVDAPATVAAAPWSRPKKWADQADIESAEDAVAKVRAHYRLGPKDNTWGGPMLRPNDKSTKVGIADEAVWGLRDKVQLVESVDELVQPGMVEKLKERGYSGNFGMVATLLAAGSAKGAVAAARGQAESRTVDIKIWAVDEEGRGRLVDSMQPWYKKAWARIVGDSGGEPLKRPVQRVTIQYDENGGIAAAYIRTWAWPPRGLRGMNVESISWHARGEPSRHLSNEGLHESVGVSMGANLLFTAAREHAKAARS